MSKLIVQNSEYPSIDTMLSFIKSNPQMKVTKIDLDSLSVNGDFVKDEMNKYLNLTAISSSVIAKCPISPKAAKVEFDKGYTEIKDRKKNFLELGTLIHEAILEPRKFKVAIAPQCNLTQKNDVKKMIRFYNGIRKRKRSLKGISKWNITELREELNELSILCKHHVVTNEQKEIIDSVVCNAKEYCGGIIPQLLNGAISELSCYSVDSTYPLFTKIRPDFINIEENIGVNIIGSLKTTSTESIEAFRKQAIALNYGMKEGFYQRIMSHVTGRNFATVMIVAQTVPPFDVFIQWWDGDSIAIGMQEAEYYLEILSECFEKDYFPGIESKAEYGNRGIINLDLYGEYVTNLPCFNTEKNN